MTELTKPSLPCGSLRIHGEHLWTGQTTGEVLFCPGHADPTGPAEAMANRIAVNRPHLPEVFKDLDGASLGVDVGGSHVALGPYRLAPRVALDLSIALTHAAEGCGHG